MRSTPHRCLSHALPCVFMVSASSRNHHTLERLLKVHGCVIVAQDAYSANPPLSAAVKCLNEERVATALQTATTLGISRNRAWRFVAWQRVLLEQRANAVFIPHVGINIHHGDTLGRTSSTSLCRLLQAQLYCNPAHHAKRDHGNCMMSTARLVCYSCIDHVPGQHRVLLSGAEDSDDDDAVIPAALNTALVEALCYPDLMDDAVVAASLGDALLALTAAYEMALDDGTRYPGLYRLLASPRPQLRELVGCIPGEVLLTCLHSCFCSRERPAVV